MDQVIQWRRSGVFIVNFGYIFTPFSSVSMVDFELVNVNLEGSEWLEKTLKT